MNYLIIGGGISGLSAAWFLKKKDPLAKITLLEKENRLGGWIRTSHEEGFLFEKGPRTFQIGRSPHLLQLIHDLKLEKISSDPCAQRRFILHKQKLRSPWSFLPKIFPFLLRELFIKPSEKEDETIYDFAVRRFGPTVAELFFDPLALGIYAGDIRKLSIHSCFPSLVQFEKEKGSIIKGLFKAPKKGGGLFTLKNGMETLIQELEKRLSIDIVLGSEVKSFSEYEAVTEEKTWTADRVICALPPKLKRKSLWVVNIAYDHDVLSKKAFGYLVPTKEQESILGCIFDSAIFPQQGEKTRLTVMVREEESKPLDAALNAIDRHLGLKVAPIYSSLFFAKDAIPQPEVGSGYRDGISVDASIRKVKILIDKIFSTN